MVIPEPENRTESDSQSPESSENPSHSDPQKKTRDLPNLTECHACGFKVDMCTGKNKLRPLYSEWRIVLLCNKCFSCVQSSQICSYCFSASSSDSFRCTLCQHSVHKNCFFKFRDVAPWSYSCLGSEFSVCVDCWVPKHVEISRRRSMRSLRKLKSGVILKKGRVDLEKEGSRVLKGGKFIRSMEDVVKDGNCKMKSKIEAVARTRDVAAKGAVVSKRAVELGNREESTLNLPPKMDSVKFVGGSYLTFDLRLNSSPRVSKSRCLLSTSYLDAPKKWISSVNSSRNASGSDNMLDSDSSTDLSCPCMGGSDMIAFPKGGECTAAFGVEEIGEEALKEGEGSCSDRLINLSREGCGLEHDRKQADAASHREERKDRYFLKYCRRKSDRYQLKYSRRSNRYFLKYSRRKPDRYTLKYSRRNCLRPTLNSLENQDLTV
ncbi:hypothetical protein RYX36_000719 [Vicia faba]